MKSCYSLVIHFFSLGCGRIFEGTYEMMFNSLNIIKKFPLETKVYCGHEYTLQNSKFVLSMMKVILN